MAFYIALHLVDVLICIQIFLLATKRISKTDVPLLHQVIPIIDLLTTNLTDTIANEDIEPVVRTAAARGLAVLNKYYSATDDSIMYRVAMREFILLLRLYCYTNDGLLQFFTHGTNQSTSDVKGGSRHGYVRQKIFFASSGRSSTGRLVLQTQLPKQAAAPRVRAKDQYVSMLTSLC